MIDASETKYRRLFEGMLDGYVRTDLDGNIQLFNAAYQKMHGYSEEELLSMTYMDLTPEKWQSMEAEIMEKQTLKNGYSELYEKEYRRKDGTLVPIELRVYLERDAENKPVGYWAIVRDISDRKRSEEALTSSELKYHMLFDTSMDGIAFTNMDGVFLEVNHAFSEMIGYSQEELLSMDYRQVTPDRWREREQEIHETQVMQRGHSFEYEKEYMRKDGTIIPVMIRTWLVRDENGNDAYVIASARDITDRKRAEDELRESEEKHRTLINSMQDLVFVYDEAGRHAQIYASSEDMLVAPLEELITKRIADVLPERFRKDYLEKIKKVRATGNTDTIDYWLEIEDRIRWFSAILSRHDDGKSVVAVIRDITDRKKAENALKERESFLANIFASIQDGISVLDKDLRIVQVNPRMEEWYEHTKPLVGKKCYEAYHEREKPCEVCPTLQTLESGERALEVVPKRGPGGSIAGWLDLYSFPLYDSEDNLLGVIEYVRDITERHSAQKEIKATADACVPILGSDGPRLQKPPTSNHYGHRNPSNNEP